MKDLRVVFMGTPNFSVPVLEALIKNTNVVLVVTQPDKEVGRKKILEESPISLYASMAGKEVFKPKKIREDYERILEVNPDIIVTCAYGQIIPKILLDTPKYNAINVHASLLPKYRGGAPIHRAIMNGEAETGITIMYMDEGMDSGDIIKQKSISISEEDNLDSVSERLSNLGSELLIETLPSMIDGSRERTKQNEEDVTFAYVIKREDELIDFNKTTEEVFNKIRALSTKPLAYFMMNDKTVKVVSARKGSVKGEVGVVSNIYNDGFGIGTKDGEIIITRLQPEGKKAMDAKDYLNGVDKNNFKGTVVNEGKI